MSKIKVLAGRVPPGGCEENSMSHLSLSFQGLSGILGCFLACRGITPICPCLHMAYSSVCGYLFLFLQKSVSSDVGLTPFITDDLIFRSLIKSAKILFPYLVTFTGTRGQDSNLPIHIRYICIYYIKHSCSFKNICLLFSI